MFTRQHTFRPANFSPNNFQIFYLSEPLTRPPTSELFRDYWNFLYLQRPLTFLLQNILLNFFIVSWQGNT